MHVDLSAAQHIPFGKMLSHLYYSNQSLLEQAPGRSGYPHNGGEHTLMLSGDKGDIISFLDLITEKYPNVLCEATKIQIAVQRWKEGEPHVRAQDLFSQRIYDYHETYQYKVIDGVVHFYPRVGYTYQEYARQAIYHLELISDWGKADAVFTGLVHLDDFMTVQIFHDDDTLIYRERVRREHVAIAKLYGDDVA